MEVTVSIETNTKIGLISKALILLGESPLTSLSDDRYGATVGSDLFELIYENELQSNAWRFAIKKKALSRLNVEPLNTFKYAYQIPTDCLLPRAVIPPVSYEIYGDRIYTDATVVELDYLFKPSVDQVPAHFALLLVYALARDMCNPITSSEDGVRVFQSKYMAQRNRAMYADAQGRPATPIVSSPFTDVRGW